jgi:O-methyltransferase
MRLPKLTPPAPDDVQSFFFPLFWGVSQPDVFVQHMKAALGHVAISLHCADNFVTWGRNNSMLSDGAFVAAWQGNAQSDADKAIVWRRYILACAGYHCVHLDGDFVECGAYAGVGAKTVIDYLGGTEFPRRFWLYDLFEHAEGMTHPAMPAHGPQLYDEVVRRFEGYGQVEIRRGRIPEVFADGAPERIAYLHIDLNEAAGEIAALDALFDRVQPGGLVILDDYEWAGVYRGQKLAEDPWFDARSYRVFPLPTGQGIVIKR